VSNRYVSRRGLEHLLFLIVIVVSSPSCVGSARTFQAYEADAVATAAEVRSAAGTAILAVNASRAERITANYLSVVLSETEDAGSSAQSQFDSVQPPGAEADRLRANISPTLDKTNKILTELRIAVRRSDLEGLPALAEPLRELVSKLDDFTTEHDR
jgi:hypothetical protein